MTGPEVPISKAVASAAKSVLKDDGTKKQLQKLASDSPNMKAASESYARQVAIKQAFLLKLYQPLARFLGTSADYFSTDFHSDMAQKLKDIPDEHLTSPAPSVAIPAMEGLRYAVEEPDLKDMYLNLLATATDDRLQEQAHPAFADIIKQLSPAEARMLLDVLRADVLAIVRISRKAETGEGETALANHVMNLTHRSSKQPVEIPSIAVWVDNWIRLGLVEVDYIRHLTDPDRYKWVDLRPEVIRFAESDPRGEQSLVRSNGILLPTDFGRQFLSAVSFDGVEITAAEDPSAGLGSLEAEDG